MRIILIIIIVVGLSACIVVPVPTPTTQSTEKPAKQEHPETVRKDESRSSPQQAAPEQIQTIADTIKTCKRIQSARDIPVTCSTEYIDGKPTMVMGFPSRTVASEWLEALTDNVATPYCRAANKSNRQAFLGVTIYDDNEGRIFSCEKDEWSDWFALNEDKESKTPQNIAESITACENIQAANELPIGCKPTYIDGKLTLILAFPDRTTLQQYIEPISLNLGGPFCASAKNANRAAFIIFALQRSNTVRFYSCETGEVSDWRSLEGSGV